MSKDIKFTNRRITVSVGRTINMGDFNSFRVDTQLAADISDEANIDDAYRDLFDEASCQLVQYENEIGVNDVKNYKDNE